MTTDTDPGAQATHPYLTYVLGSVVLWMVCLPLIDWVIGEWRGLGSSLVEGAFMGLLFGLSMYPIEQWLRRRKIAKDRAPKPPDSSKA